MTNDLRTLLRSTWESGGFTTRSDFARDNPETIAAAAYLGLISTLSPEGEWTRTWRLTKEGLNIVFSAENYASAAAQVGG